MTRKEIADLLEIMVNQYPYIKNKIEDAGAMVSAWELILGDCPAESVYKAARLHMESSKFFPTIADIREKMVRAELIYQENARMLEGSGVRRIGKGDNYSDEQLENLCRFVGLGYPNELEK